MKFVSQIYRSKQNEFKNIPGNPWVYWITPGLQQLFKVLPKLRDVAQPRQGLATADNFRFLRFWWEVGKSQIGFDCQSQEECEERLEKWYPHTKGGGFCKWYGNQEYVINYGQNGHELKAWATIVNPSGWSRRITSIDYYFRRGVTWSALSSSGISARLMPEGFIIGHKGPASFADSIDEEYLVLGVLNSELAQTLLAITSPTIMFEVGQIAQLPVPKNSSSVLSNLVEQAIQIAMSDSAEDETTYDFQGLPWGGSIIKTIDLLEQKKNQLHQVEQRIDEKVYRLYGMEEEDQTEIEAALRTGSVGAAEGEEGEEETDEDLDIASQEQLIDSSKLSLRWISYAVGIVLGRFQPGIPEELGSGRFEPDIALQLRQLADEDCVATLETNHPDDLATKVEQALELMLGEAGAIEMLQAVLGNRGEPADLLRTYLAQNFFKQHVQQYRKRPVYWLLQSPKKLYSLYLFHERISPDTLALIRGNRYLASKINQTQLAITEVQGRIPAAQGKQKRDLEKELERLMALQSDLEAFDRAIGAVLTARNERGETVGWRLEIDDGIILNLAPLYELMPAWKTEPKKYWDKLQSGDYDWSYTAMRYYPDRVTSKCQKNRSYAIAHGLEDEFESQD